MKYFFYFIFIFILQSCAYEEPNYENKPIKDLYEKAMKEMTREEYQKAADLFIEIEVQYPFSKWSSKGILMASYAYYKDKEYTKSILEAERFIKLNPASKDAPYARYLIISCYLNQMSSVDADQSMTAKALENMRILARNYPNTKYTDDIKDKIRNLVELLSAKEMNIGRKYLFENQYLSAIKRFQNVIINYPDTTQAPEAYYRISETYVSLGDFVDAKKTIKTLKEKYPDNKMWIENSNKLIQNYNL